MVAQRDDVSSNLDETKAPAAEGQPGDLLLRPLEGLASWVPASWFSAFFRALSMAEQPEAARTGALSTEESFFRRDRYVHPEVDASTWRLRVEGVASPREFSLDDLLAMPQSEEVCVVECSGNGHTWMGSAGLIGQARWGGVRLMALIEACGGPGPSTDLVFHGQDGMLGPSGYDYGLSVEELRQSDAVIALRFNGAPLSRARGFPARLIVPNIYSMSHVKWLARIEGKDKPHDGLNNTLVYTNKRKKDGKWVREQARWIGLKSLITRCAPIEEASRAFTLSGWAWGGEAPIVGVEVSTDHGQTWTEATFQAPEQVYEPGARLKHAWALFSYRWEGPARGDHVVAARARSADGHVQPAEEPADRTGHFDQVRIKWRRVTVP